MSEESNTGEQLLGGLAIGILAAGFGYALGHEKKCNEETPLCKVGDVDPWGPLIYAGYGGGGAAVGGLALAVLSDSYRVGGLATSAGGVVGFVFAGFAWKRKHSTLGFTKTQT